MTADEGSVPFIYHDDFKFDATAHRPPLPFGHPHYKHNRPSKYIPSPRSESQLDYVLKYHPVVTDPVENPRQIKVTIIKQLTNKDSTGARVFVCKIRPDDIGHRGRTDLFVAKIYDPLCYSFAALGSEYVKSNVVVDSDRDYSREAAAYEHLRQSGHDGDLAPAYYGSWTFDAPTKEGSRPVRLIIIEYIPAPSLYQEYYHSYLRKTFHKEIILPNERSDLSDEFRLRIAAHVMDILCRQIHLGLDQADVAPRNIVVLLSGTKRDEPEKRTIQRVVLVDYNNSFVGPRKYAWDFTKDARPPNPIQLFWNGGLSEFESWLPKRWYKDKDFRHKWLYAFFGRSQHYEPLIEEVDEELAVFLKRFKKDQLPDMTI